MLRRACYAVGTALFMLAVVGIAGEARSEQATMSAGTPMCYTPNVGQWDEFVVARIQSPKATLWLTREGLDYQFVRKVESADAGDRSAEVKEAEYEQYVLKSTLVGASLTNPVFEDEVLSWRCNYFLGNDPAKWKTDVRSYNTVVFKDVYPGIDMKYYAKEGHPAYDFVLSPGADPSMIQMQFADASSIALNVDHDLVIAGAWADIIHSQPYTYFETDKSAEVRSMFTISNEDRVGLSVMASAPRAERMVIDPGILFSTFVGGSGNDVALDCASSPSSNDVWISGFTMSSNFPTQSAFQTTNGGNIDAFVTRFNSNGTGLVYSTYLGGSGSDEAHGISVRNNLAHICGSTWSPNFPMAAPLDNSKGGDVDAFITELASNGASLRFSTYLGGASDDDAQSILVGPDRTIYVTGTTYSSGFPTTYLCWDNTYNGFGDAFATKYTADGGSIAYSTYIGGTDGDDGYGICIDAQNRAWITGYTHSSNFWTTNGAFDQSYNGSTDAFVFRLSNAGGYPVYSTFLGGSGADYGYSIASDSLGRIFVGGRTTSSGFPTLGAFDASYNGLGDAFVTKFDTTGALQASTYLGGSSSEDAQDITIVDGSAVWITGATVSTDLPMVRPNDPLFGGMNDGYVAKLSYNLSNLLFSTYFGGSNYDEPFGISQTASGQISITGHTRSTDYPTLNPWDGTFNGGDQDCFVIVFSPACCTNRSGNVDCDPNDGVDISDYSRLVDYLYISFDQLCCYEESNIDGAGSIDISDLSALADYLWGNGTLPAVCQ